MKAEDVGIFTLILFAGTSAFVLIRAIANRIEAGGKKTAALPPHETTARMERMEAAVESIAIEVERISESQRFLTTLLADRERTALPVSRQGDQQ